MVFSEFYVAGADFAGYIPHPEKAEYDHEAKDDFELERAETAAREEKEPDGIYEAYKKNHSAQTLDNHIHQKGYGGTVNRIDDVMFHDHFFTEKEITVTGIVLV